MREDEAALRLLGSLKETNIHFLWLFFSGELNKFWKNRLPGVQLYVK